MFRHIESFRDRLTANPLGVREEIQAFLAREKQLKPADRVQLLGLVVLAGKKLGEFKSAEEAALEALEIGSTSAVATADLLLQLAILRMTQERPKEALEVVDRARRLVAEVLEKPEPSAKVSRGRRKWVKAMEAAAYLVRGEIFLHQSEGSIEQALADALEALRLTADLVRAYSYVRRVHLSATILLCALLVQFGPPEKVAEATKMIDEAEKTLIYRCRLAPDHVHRVKLKWTRALAMDRMGAARQAEGFLADIIERLIATGHKGEAQRGLDNLLWVIKGSRKPGRAIYYRLKYGALRG